MTVGYGDISANNTAEMIISILWMLCGAGVYSFTVGTLSSFLSNIDTREQDLNLKTIYVN